MQNDGSDRDGIAVGGHSVDQYDLEKQGNMESEPREEENGTQCSLRQSAQEGTGTVLALVISKGESQSQVSVTSELKGSVTVTRGTNRDEITDMVTPKKGCLSRNESSHEQCRVCQQQTEEPLIDLGCQCRGGLANAHRSCIDTWFRTRGSNKCEICQQVAANVPRPEPQSSTNYWIWRVDPAFGGSNIAQERERWFSPLWVAFSILIGGLLLDVLISISLGVSALPVNIIIGMNLCRCACCPRTWNCTSSCTRMLS
ncbi:PREDICTED: uncharacterized protein LOC104593165 isoform X2 [Nelumbo nucifera]|uniref:Uncharacterized protein LOC104593165 isoform X2 n=1 Tax=Nelumbo nucifera TaxID=4432 RepID=A0A1U7ZI84_NELNU|nr:PREDICTED: uncharacterized protein LOC104593165 isoform X2 [Nelumbo nucifera]